MSKVLAIAYVLMAIFLSNAPVLAENLGKGRPAAAKPDTIKRVTVRVVAKERPPNYDSLFQSQPNHFERSAKNKPANVSVKRIRKKQVKATNSRTTLLASARRTGKLSTDLLEKTPEVRLPVTTEVRGKQKKEVKQTVATTTGAETESAEEELFLVAGESQAKPGKVVTETDANTVRNDARPQTASVIANVLPENPATNGRNDLSIEHSPKANKISYMWIGFVLVLAGVVLGLVFGRTAFMVSAVGIVFLIIGFLI